MKKELCLNNPDMSFEEENRSQNSQINQTNEFSFLIDTQNFQKNQSANKKIFKNDKQDIDSFLTQLRQINQNLTDRMNRMNQQIQLEIQKHEDKKTKEKIKSQLFHKGKQFYNSKGLIGISSANEDVFSVKKHLIQNKQVQTPSNFEIDQNQNFIKLNSKTTQKQNINLKVPKISLMSLVQQKRTKPKLTVPNLLNIQQNSKKVQKRRIYESVLSKFSTASLIAMNKTE